jgi:hypothetical protein
LAAGVPAPATFVLFNASRVGAPDHNIFIFVAWEHRKIASIVRALLAAHGADAEMVKKVQDWDRKDFDSMYVVRSAKQKPPSIKSISMDSRMDVLVSVLFLNWFCGAVP